LITAALTLMAAGAFAQPAATPPTAMQSQSMMHSADGASMHQGNMMHHGTNAMMSQDENGTMKCADMAKMHDAMKEKMAAMDTKLDGLIETMNASKGSAKVDAMAAVINELVAQRGVMRDAVMSMQPMMMGHMGNGTMKGASEGTWNCPMMKQATNDPGTTPAEQH